MQHASRIVDRYAWPRNRVEGGTRTIPEETALALTYNGGTYAVMMGTPCDLEDFGVGFSLNVGSIDCVEELESLEIIRFKDGVEVRMWLRSDRAKSLNERRRLVAGPTGCGLCGIDSIAEAVRPAITVGLGPMFSPAEVMAAMRSISDLQRINTATRAVHAAAFWTPVDGVIALREDVGRHNALDKLAGALARGNVDAIKGIIVLTSRVSIEMVQKTALIGASLMVAISAPTALAVRTANSAGICLVGIARDDGFEVFSHPHRLSLEDAAGDT
jgi:FdhD protein